MSIKVLIILGTNREGNLSKHVAKLVKRVGDDMEGVDVTLVTPDEFDIKRDGAKDPKYTQLVQDADAFFIVTPEYNRSYPPSLKRMIDAEFKAYKNKAVALAGVSNGPWGGTRVLVQLSDVVKRIGLKPCQNDVNFAFVQNVFNEDGDLVDNDYVERVENLYAELLSLAEVLKWGRENNKFN